MKIQPVIVVCLTILLWSSSQAQDCETPPVNHVKVKLPSMVKVAFDSLYPGAENVEWLGTNRLWWLADASPHWYCKWYPASYWEGVGSIIKIHLDQPDHFEVHFDDEELNMVVALFNKRGKWVETRMSISELPDTIELALSQSKYVKWHRSSHMEKIHVPDRYNHIETTYRLRLHRGESWVIVRFSETGEILQRRTWLGDN